MKTEFGHRLRGVAEATAEAAVNHPVATAMVGTLLLAAAIKLAPDEGDALDAGSEVVAENVSTEVKEVYLLDGEPIPSDSRFMSPNYTHSAGGFDEVVACSGINEVLVEEGDTLRGLAGLIDSRQLGPELPDSSSRDARIGVLQEMNDIDDPDVIYEDDILGIPKVCAVFSVVPTSGG